MGSNCNPVVLLFIAGGHGGRELKAQTNSEKIKDNDGFLLHHSLAAPSNQHLQSKPLKQGLCMLPAAARPFKHTQTPVSGEPADVASTRHVQENVLRGKNTELNGCGDLKGKAAFSL